jgi:hypothetical protein
LNSQTILLYHAALKRGMDSRQASLYALGEPLDPGFLERWHKVIGLIAAGFCFGAAIATYGCYQRFKPFPAPDAAPTMPAIHEQPAKVNKQVNV